MTWYYVGIIIGQAIFTTILAIRLNTERKDRAHAMNVLRRYIAQPHIIVSPQSQFMVTRQDGMTKILMADHVTFKNLTDIWIPNHSQVINSALTDCGHVRTLSEHPQGVRYENVKVEGTTLYKGIERVIADEL